MIKAVATDGKIRELMMLPINKLNGWLFGIDANRVKKESQKDVIRYQEECFDVLANHFLPKSNYGLKDDPINTAPKVNEWQKQYIRECVAEKAYRESRSRQAIYWDLSKEFFVNSYHELHEQEFEAVALWLGFPWINLTPKTIALTAERFGELCIFEEENKQLRKAINTLMNNQILGKAQNVKAKTYHTDSIQSAIEVILDGIDILDEIGDLSNKIKDATNTVLSGIALLDNAVATAQPA
jgi:hypothetical protein